MERIRNGSIGEAMPYRLRRENEVQPVWHRAREDALRAGLPHGWTSQGGPGWFDLADGVVLEENPPRAMPPPRIG